MEHVRVLNEYGLLDAEAIEATKSRIWARKGGLRDDNPWRLFVNVEVVGTRGGVAWRRVYDASHPDWGQEGTGKMTGICAAVGVQLLGRHGRTAARLRRSRAVLSTRTEFLAELAARNAVEVTWTRRAARGGGVNETSATT